VADLQSNAGYDALEHLCRSIFPIDAKEKVLAMLTAYFDESGTDGRSPIVAVGGYISTQQLWHEFQCEWKQFLTDEGLSIFHTADLLSRQGKFTAEAGWPKERVTGVMEKADSFIAKHVLFGIVSYTHIEECEKAFPLKDENGTRKKYSAEYLFSGVQMIWGINQWARENGFTEPIKYVFEDGATGKGYLADAVSAARRDLNNQDRSLIGGVSFEDKNAVPQLQAADKLTHQTRKAIVRFNEGKEADIIIQRLIKTRLSKVFRFDSENLPLLRALRDAAVLEREQGS
jgi:hypothetical protein